MSAAQLTEYSGVNITVSNKKEGGGGVPTEVVAGGCHIRGGSCRSEPHQNK